MKQITTILLVSSAALLMTACGGGSSSSGEGTTPPTDTAPPPSSFPEIVDYGTANYSPFSNYVKYYEVKGMDFYYDTDGCDYPNGGQFNYEAYDDNTITIAFNLSDGSEYITNCRIEKKFIPIFDVMDGDVNASFIAYDLFYDNDTKINYLHDGYYNSGVRLVEIINDGQSGIVEYTHDSNITAQVMLESVFQEVPLY